MTHPSGNPQGRHPRLPRHWLALLFLFIIADPLICLQRESITTFEPWVYLVSTILSLALFWSLDTLRRIFPRVLASPFTIVVTFLLTFLLFASVLVYRQFGDFITFSKLQFVFKSPLYFWVFVRDALLNIKIVLFVAGWGLLAWLWGPRRPASSPAARWRYGALFALLLTIYLVGLNQFRYHAKGRHLSIDTSFAVALKQLRMTTVGGLHSSTRIPLVGYQPHDSIDVLVIINESFGSKALTGESSIPTAMPFLQDWIRRDSTHVIAYPRAFASSSATDVSVPSLLTGVAPFRPSKRLHEAPLLWDWARAGGYTTILVSAQLYEWAQFDQFFLTPGPDIYLTAGQMHEPITNDTGVDELAAMRRLCDTLRSLPADRHFCAVYNSNALHYPFHASTRFRTITPQFHSAYRNAALVLDAALQELVASLDSMKRLEQTLIIITGDHGETDSLVHSQTHRLYSFYDEIMRVPFIVHFPDHWLSNRPDCVQRLKTNTSELTGNIDIIPTVVDAIGALSKPENEQIAEKLDGYSLLRPTPAERTMVALNTNEIRQWEHEGFGFYWDDMRFVYSDIEPPGLFNALIDSLEKHNLWPDAPSADRQRVLGTIDTIFELKRMYGPIEQP